MSHKDVKHDTNETAVQREAHRLLCSCPPAAPALSFGVNEVSRSAHAAPAAAAAAAG